MDAAQKRALIAWIATMPERCAVCWWPRKDPRRGIEVHHMVGGSARAKGHEPRNYLLLCSRCHGVLHSGKIYALTPDLNARILLAVKQECDPENYDPLFLAGLRHKKHLGYDAEPVPDFFLEERRSNAGSWSRRQP
jgi:hypothetical protein